MAFLAPDEDKDKEQPQLGGSGGVGASPMTQGGARSAPAKAPGPMQPQRSAMQGGGSGFVNLQSFLTDNVAKQNQEKVKSLGSSLQTQENDAYNKAADPLRNASFSAINGNVRELVDSLVPQQQPQGGGGAGGGVTRLGGPSMQISDRGSAGPSMANAGNHTNSLAQLQAMLSQDYTGPMSVDYDPTARANMQRLSMLSNADTAMNALSPTSFVENLPAPNYGQGNRWLDESLIKGDAGTMGNISAVGKEAEAFKSKVGDEKASLEKKASGLKEDAKKARDSVGKELGTYADEILAGIDQRADALNKQESADYEGKLVRDPNTGEVVQLSPGQELEGWEAGSGAVGQGANRGNVATDAEIGKLSKLASLLGMDNYAVQDTGNYVSGRHTTKASVNQSTSNIPPELAVKPFNDAVTGAQIAIATKGMTPEQLSRFQELRRDGFSPAEAAEIAKSDAPVDINPVQTLNVKPVRG